MKKPPEKPAAICPKCGDTPRVIPSYAGVALDCKRCYLGEFIGWHAPARDQRFEAWRFNAVEFYRERMGKTP